MNEVGDGEIKVGFRIKYNDQFSIAQGQPGGKAE